MMCVSSYTCAASFALTCMYLHTCTRICLSSYVCSVWCVRLRISRDPCRASRVYDMRARVSRGDQPTCRYVYTNTHTHTGTPRRPRLPCMCARSIYVAFTYIRTRILHASARTCSSRCVSRTVHRAPDCRQALRFSVPFRALARAWHCIVRPVCGPRVIVVR